MSRESVKKQREKAYFVKSKKFAGETSAEYTANQIKFSFSKGYTLDIIDNTGQKKEINFRRMKNLNSRLTDDEVLEYLNTHVNELINALNSRSSIYINQNGIYEEIKVQYEEDFYSGLSKEDAAYEIITAGLYALMDVNIAKTYAVRDRNGNIGILSKEKKGFMSLALENRQDISGRQKIEDIVRIKKYKGKAVKGIGDFLIAAMWTADTDFVSENYNNFGLVEKKDENGEITHYEIAKFDFGNNAIHPDRSEFFHKIIGEYRVRNTIRNEYGQIISDTVTAYRYDSFDKEKMLTFFKLHPQKASIFFAHISDNDKIESLRKLSNITNQQITAVVQKVPDDLLSQNEKQKIIDRMISRRHEMKDILMENNIKRFGYGGALYGLGFGLLVGLFLILGIIEKMTLATTVVTVTNVLFAASFAAATIITPVAIGFIIGAIIGTVKNLIDYGAIIDIYKVKEPYIHRNGKMLDEDIPKTPANKFLHQNTIIREAEYLAQFVDTGERADGQSHAQKFIKKPKLEQDNDQVIAIS